MNTNASSSTTSQWLVQATKQLEFAGIGTARLDCLVLLEDITATDRTHLLAQPDTKLTIEQISLLDDQLSRRIQHEPLAYIRGKTEFYGREFIVDHHVLQPRPESETMIDLLKKLTLSARTDPGLSVSGSVHIVDVGTGCGALGITAALEIPGSTMDLIDIDPECLNVARKNLEKHKVTAELLEGDLLTPIKRSPTHIVANLPYVPDSHTINEAAMHEPKLAIFGGPDGLELYRKLFEQVDRGDDKPLYVFTESLPFQHAGLVSIAKNYGYKIVDTEDFIQVFKLK